MATVRGWAEDVQLTTMIGHQGSNINEIQAKTETRINFRDELETDTHRVATVRGQAEDVQIAEVSLHQTITAQQRLETLTTLMCPVGPVVGSLADRVTPGCRMDVARDPHNDNIRESKGEKSHNQVSSVCHVNQSEHF